MVGISLTVLWIILAAAFLVLELVTVGMVSIWFMVGALAALAASVLHAAVWVQVVVFLAVSVVCFVLLFPKLRRFVGKNRQATNADMVLGQTCLVVRRIDNIAETGAVTVGGKTWTARSSGGDTIEEGALVRADSIQGVKLMVSPIRPE